jgi:hypothetical protein
MSVTAGLYPAEVSWNITGVDGGSVSGFAPATVPFSINTVCGGPIGGTVLQVATGDMTPQQLITDVFLGDCLSASNITFTGNAGAIGTFSSGGAIGIESGIILTTGSVFDAPGPNTSASTSVVTGAPGYPLLDMITGFSTFDASVFTFDFVAQTDQVSFNYVFASEEYPEYVCSNYNDAFGFFVSGPGYSPNTNIALIPSTSMAVAINAVNSGVQGMLGTAGGCTSLSFSSYYVDNVGGSFLEYDGYTVPLTATISTVPCATYQIVIVVADVGDGLLDSAVFLEAQSFTAGVDVQIGAAATVSGGQSSAVNCEETGYFLFVNDGEPFTEPMTLTFTVSGSALINPIPTSITFQPGEQSVILDVEAVVGALGADPSSVVITLDPDQGCSCDDNNITAELFFCAQVMLPVEWLSFEAQLSADEREVRCAWETLSEVNNDYFVLERSADGTSWIDLGTVAGSGTSNDLNDYTFIDKSPLQGISYYRVRQVDYHGAIDHSPIRSVERKQNDQLGAYPNPGNGVFTLSGYANGDLFVYDLSGRRVPYSLNFRGELTLNGAAPGWYVIELAAEDPAQTQRITVVVQ